MQNPRRVRYGKVQDLGGDSGVAFYEIGPESITVQFTMGATYLYNYRSAGQHHIEQMKALAIAGHGLNGYIKDMSIGVMLAGCGNT
ncbi:hypothetical protein BZL42_24875 [Pseudomonas indica]|nr:hypothetical protein BZL42_24875 [Pseudomonas indica]